MFRRCLLNYAFIIICTIVILSNCATITEPDDKHSTLLLGTVALLTKAVSFDGSIKSDAIYREGIQITIQNYETKAFYELQTKKDGLFFTRELSSGWYFFKRFYYKNPGSANPWMLNGPGGEIYFYIMDGKVNNLGSLTWYIGRVGYNQFKVSKDYNEVHNQFVGTFPQSGWLRAIWQNTACEIVPIRSNNDQTE